MLTSPSSSHVSVDPLFNADPHSCVKFIQIEFKNNLNISENHTHLSKIKMMEMSSDSLFFVVLFSTDLINPLTTPSYLFPVMSSLDYMRAYLSFLYKLPLPPGVLYN